MPVKKKTILLYENDDDGDDDDNNRNLEFCGQSCGNCWYRVFCEMEVVKCGEEFVKDL